MSKLTNYFLAAVCFVAAASFAIGCGHLFSRETRIRASIAAATQAVTGAEAAVNAQCADLPKCEAIQATLAAAHSALDRAARATREENFDAARKHLDEAKKFWADLRELGLAFLGELPETPTPVDPPKPDAGASDAGTEHDAHVESPDSGSDGGE